MEVVAKRQWFLQQKIRMTSRAASSMEEESAMIKYNRNPWGELDYAYYKKQKEEKEKKLNKADY